MLLNFVGRPGRKGEKGDHCRECESGPKGMTGATGPPGPQGFPGNVGFPGINGEKGVKGFDGYRGFPGTPVRKKLKYLEFRYSKLPTRLALFKNFYLKQNHSFYYESLVLKSVFVAFFPFSFRYRHLPKLNNKISFEKKYFFIQTEELFSCIRFFILQFF